MLHAVLLITAVLVSGSGQDATKRSSGQPTTQAADQTAPVRAAVIAYYRAVAQGDAEKAKALSIAGPEEDGWIDASVAINRAKARLFKSATSRFGKEHSIVSQKTPADRELEQARGAAITISDNHAVLVMNERKVTLTSVNGEWKLDWPETLRGSGQLAATADMVSLVASEYDAEAARINAGEYATAKEAEADLNRRIKLAAIRSLRLAPSTTRPATQPGAGLPHSGQRSGVARRS